MDRAGDSATEGNGHAADTAGDRALAQSCAVQHFDPDTLVETKFAQPSRFRHTQLGPGNSGHSRALAMR
jgi:hypothetical protein